MTNPLAANSTILGSNATSSSPESVAFAMVTSAAFWTAVAAVGTIVSLLFIYRQISSAKNVTALDFLLKEDARFRSEEMKQSRSELAHCILARPQDFVGMSDSADAVLDYLEDLGMMLRKGIADEDFMWTFKGYWILNYWEALSNYVSWSRKTYKDSTLWSEFEMLQGRISKVEARSGGRRKITKNDVLQFLEDDELQLQIESMTPNRMDAVVEIEDSSFPRGEAYSRKQLEELYEKHLRGFMVATILGEVVGYAVGYTDKGAGEVDSIAVHPEFVRHGIGRKLLSRVYEQIESKGPVDCFLEVRTTNDPAISFYESMGFEKVKTLPRYYDDGADAYLMRRPASRQ